MSSSQQRQQRAAFNRIYEHNTKSHHNIRTHLLTQNPNTESFPLRDKTQTETCFSLAKDQIEYFFKRCAGMYCTCNGSNLSLFLAGVGFGYITLWLCSTLVSFNFRFIEYTCGPKTFTMCDRPVIYQYHVTGVAAHLFLN